MSRTVVVVERVEAISPAALPPISCKGSLDKSRVQMAFQGKCALYYYQWKHFVVRKLGVSLNQMGRYRGFSINFLIIHIQIYLFLSV